MSGILEFRLLGPVEVRIGEAVAVLGGSRQRSVLAILLLHANEVVPSDRLIDLVWGESPPETAATALQGYVSRLRRAIEPDREAGDPFHVIVTEGAGYRARVVPGQLDVHRFEALAARGRQALTAGSAREAERALAEAIALWRGPALADVRNESFAQEPIRRLEELRLVAVEDRLEAQLALGQHREAIPELQALISAQPLRERPRALLMLALYRSGRQAEALEEFGAARRLLVDELGIEPGEPLRQLHQRVLEQDPSLRLPAAPRQDAAKAGRRQLPVALGAAGTVVVVAIILAAIVGGDGTSSAPAPPANSLVLLDPDDGTIRRAFAVGGTPTSVAVGEDAAWVLNADDHTISRIDERTHEVKTFGSGGVPTDLAAGAGAVWVGNGRRIRAQFVGPVATSVVRLDPTSTAVRGAVELPAPGGNTTNLQQDRIAVTREAIWVVNPDASVSRVDPATAKVSAVVRNARAGALAVGDEGIWALGLDPSLARIDAEAAEVDRRVRIRATTLTSVAVGGGAVWAAAPHDGTVWRVDPGPRTIQRTIDVGTGVSDVAYGLGSVWAVNGLRGTLTRIDPGTNRVTTIVELGNTPRQVAVGAGGVWVTVAGAAGAPVPAAAGSPGQGPALPAATCGRVFYGGQGVPDRLIVSDMPLRGGDALPTQQMSEAIAYVLRKRGFRAGEMRIGYQSCDDSTGQTGIFDVEKCAANAKLYAKTPAVIGEVGPFNSGCAAAQIPIANRAPGGPLPMISPTNSDVGLTHATPLTPQGAPDRLYPTGRRNYVRLYAREDVQAAANAVFAHKLGARRVTVLSDGGYGEHFAFHFSRAARALGIRIVLSRRWRPETRSYGGLAAAVARTRPHAVFAAGLLDTNGGRLLRDLRDRLPAGTEVLANDGFLPVSALFEAAGPAAYGVHVSVGRLTLERLPREGAHFVTQFAGTQSGRPVEPASVYAAQATEMLLDAIAASNGSRASVAEALRASRVHRGVLGSVAFDAAGDVVPAPVSIVRARRGGGSRTVESTDGARTVQVIAVPARLLR